MSSLYSELENLYDQDFMNGGDGNAVLEWLIRHREDIVNIEIDYLNDITTALEKVATLEKRLENCIEPKFKQGDKCYVIETRYVNEVEYFGENIDGIITFEEGCRCGCYPDRYSVEKRENVFATEEEAKAKLEEFGR